jgi:translation initiation factor 2B subunit (eIF-2B alpha/beta/delta family)
MRVDRVHFAFYEGVAISIKIDYLEYRRAMRLMKQKNNGEATAKDTADNHSLVDSLRSIVRFKIKILREMRQHSASSAQHIERIKEKYALVLSGNNAISRRYSWIKKKEKVRKLSSKAIAFLERAI